MRIRFTRAGCSVAVGVAVTAMLAMSAGAPSAYAKPLATTACSSHCVDVSFQVPGPSWILGAHSGRAVVNAVVRLLPGSNGASKEDFRYTKMGTVFPLYCMATGQAQTGSTFTNNQCHLLFQAGLLEARTFSLEFDPNNGGSKNVCIGSWGDTVANGWKLRLETCGIGPDTVLLLAPKLPGGNTSTGDWLINGASDNFSTPLVASSDGYAPSDAVWRTVNFNGGKAVDTQEIHFKAGAFGSVKT
jgi:hypothetical protein